MRMSPDLWPGCQTFERDKFVLKSVVSPFTRYKVAAWHSDERCHSAHERRSPVRGTRLVLGWMTVLGQLYYHFSIVYLSGIGSPG